MSGEGQGCQLLPAQSPSHSSGEQGQTLGRTSAPPPQEGSHVTWTQHPCLMASQAKRSPSSSQPPCPTGSPPQAGHAVHSHAAAGVITELVLQQAQPVLHHFAGWGRPIIKRPVLQKAAARQDHSWRWSESRDPGQPAQGHSDKQGGCWEPPAGEGRGTGPRECPPAKLLPIISSRKPSQNTLLFSGGSPGALLPLSSVHAAVLTHPA